MRTYRQNRKQLSPVFNQGFTLVEMLVSLTLVLLMMTMFAAVFQIATGSIDTQRANAENDQKARKLSNIIRSDFAKRTFRNVQPITPRENPASTPTTLGNRQGYLYLSFNNRDSFNDDLIQLTISTAQISENDDLTPYFARATPLVDRVTGNALMSASPNQPDLDDAELRPNSTASSSAAEVCYFIRNGNLYRRVLLIREPLPVAGLDLDAQPTSFAGNDFFAGWTDPTDDDTKIATYDGNFRLPGPTVFTGSTTTFSGTDDIFTNDFYRHFDFSAHPRLTPLTPSMGSPVSVQSAEFIGLEALSNNGSVTGGAGGPNLSLGKPANRFGFDPTDGLSREHLFSVGGIAQQFMGRFLHAETSALNSIIRRKRALKAPQQFRRASRNRLEGRHPMDLDNANFTLNQFGDQ
ncbi:MAG: prepilin-type N-terminal cleavage/methylation domain-containing protein [Planctomycetaceae bacterium]